MPTWLNAAAAGAARRANERAKKMREEREESQSEWRTSTAEEDQRDMRTSQGLFVGLSMMTLIMTIFVIACYIKEKKKNE